MRVRIRKQQRGIVHGVSLSHLVLGVTYDVEPDLGGYLVTIGAADAVPSSVPALVIPLDMAKVPDFDKALGGISVRQIGKAADNPRRAPKPKY